MTEIHKLLNFVFTIRNRNNYHSDKTNNITPTYIYVMF